MLSIRETSSATHGSVEEERERTKRGQLSVVKEGSRAKIQENLGENIRCNLPRNGYGSGRLIYQKVTEQMEGIHLLQSISFFCAGKRTHHTIKPQCPQLLQQQKESNTWSQFGGFYLQKAQPEHLQQTANWLGVSELGSHQLVFCGARRNNYCRQVISV